MKVNLLDILAEGFSVDIDEDASSPDFTFLEPLRGALEIRLYKKEVIISGRVTTCLSLNCARCLKDYGFSVDAAVSVYALTEEEAGSAVVDDEEDTGIETPGGAHIDDGEIDVTGILLEYVALAIPIKQLCSEDCRGLCLQCGVDMNLSQCSCADKKTVDPRFAKLIDFKTKK